MNNSSIFIDVDSALQKETDQTTQQFFRQQLTDNFVWKCTSVYLIEAEVFYQMLGYFFATIPSNCQPEIQKILTNQSNYLEVTKYVCGYNNNQMPSISLSNDSFCAGLQNACQKLLINLRVHFNNVSKYFLSQFPNKNYKIIIYQNNQSPQTLKIVCAQQQQLKISTNFNVSSLTNQTLQQRFQTPANFIKPNPPQQQTQSSNNFHQQLANKSSSSQPTSAQSNFGSTTFAQTTYGQPTAGQTLSQSTFGQRPSGQTTFAQPNSGQPLPGNNSAFLKQNFQPPQLQPRLTQPEFPPQENKNYVNSKQPMQSTNIPQDKGYLNNQNLPQQQPQESSQNQKEIAIFATDTLIKITPQQQPVQPEFQIVHRIISNVKSNSCDVCGQNYYINSVDSILTICCNKIYHKLCFLQNLEEQSKQYLSFNNLKCFGCDQILELSFIKANLNPQLFQQITIVEQYKLSTNFCPQCKAPILFENNQGTKYTCPRCSNEICTKCRKLYHKNTECPKMRAEILKSLGDGPKIICPFCNSIYSKDEGCNHVTCKICSIDLCSACSVDRRLILAHGNHFHRIDCENYDGNSAQLNKEFEYDRSCVYCKAGSGNGKGCKKPISFKEYLVNFLSEDSS